MNLEKVTLSEKFTQISDHWNPRIAGELNGQQVKLAKFSGAFIWHSHEHEDEFFLVVKGAFRMELPDKVVELQQGDFMIVPKGTEHRPVADEEAHVLMFEPASTLNTGKQENEYTRKNLEHI